MEHPWWALAWFIFFYCVLLPGCWMLWRRLTRESRQARDQAMYKRWREEEENKRVGAISKAMERNVSSGGMG